MATERFGDKIEIAGNYQYRALTQGFYLQRWWHRLRLATAVQLSAQVPHTHILDIGCGSGTLLMFLPGHYHSYTGMDANPAAIAFCKQQFDAKHNHFLQTTFEELSQLADAKYSHIYFLEAIEHIAPKQGQFVLQQAFRLLQPGGQLIITTPNRKSCWPWIEKAMDLLRLTPRMEGAQHEHLYAPAELCKVGTQAGYHVQALVTSHLLAPWLAPAGRRVAEAIHRWETKQHWLPGNLITAVLAKPQSPE